MNAHVDLSAIRGSITSPGYEDRGGYYMFVSRGTFYFPLDPRPEEVFIEDIAHGLAHQCRFNGQCRLFLSVAEHSWHASFIGPEETALERLLHDGAEAYVGDLIRPLKLLPAVGAVYGPIERANEYVIAERFQLQYPWPPCVKIADEAVCTAEMIQNIANPEKGHLHTHIDAQIQLRYWNPQQAKGMFLYRFAELALKRGLIFEH